MLLCGTDEMDILNPNIKKIGIFLLDEKTKNDINIEKTKTEKNSFSLPFNIKSSIKKDANILLKFSHMIPNIDFYITQIKNTDEQNKNTFIDEIIAIIKNEILLKKEHIENLDKSIISSLEKSKNLETQIENIKKNKIPELLPQEINEKTYNFSWLNINSNLLCENIWIIINSFIEKTDFELIEDENIISLLNSVFENDIGTFIALLKKKSFYNDRKYIRNFISFLCSKIKIKNNKNTNQILHLSKIKYDFLFDKMYQDKYQKYLKKNQ